MSRTLPLPPLVSNAEGRERRVGVEVEFAALDLADAAALVQELYGGRIERLSPHEYRVRDARWGDFKVEIDSSFLRRVGRQSSPGLLDAIGKALIEPLAGSIVPAEIATPPVPMTELEELLDLGRSLSETGASGTSESPFHAFGVHFNPEVASRDVASLLAHLRSYVLLSDWLVRILQVDLSRRLTSFIASFPTAYLNLILAEDYAPDMRGLIRDHLAANPTRNRALDLLPLFAEIEPALVRNALPEAEFDAVSARPTWHYRLPDSLLGCGASLLRDWWTWVLVETIAEDEAKLGDLLALWRRGEGRGLVPSTWHEVAEARIADLDVVPASCRLRTRRDSG